MEVERTEIAQITEIAITPKGPMTRRVHPDKQGLLALFFRAASKGFEARRGGRLKLYDKSNGRTSDIGMMKDRMTIRIMGKTIVDIYRDRLSVDVLEVRDHIIMQSPNGPRYLYINPSGKLSVRITPPGA